MPTLSTHRCRLALAGLALAASMASVPSIAKQSEAAQVSVWSDDESFVLIKGGSESSYMHGSTNDYRVVQSLRSGKEPLLYFRRGGKSYVVRDAALLREAEAIVKPQQELGKRQGELGSRQGDLGKKQGNLGRQQAAAALRQVSGGRAEAARVQAELGRQQAELGRQQAELGRQQAVLGAEQARLAKVATAKLRALTDEALRRGLAQEVQ